MPVIIKHREEGIAKIRQGIALFANALKVSFGPRGRLVMVKKNGEGLKVTRLGIEVADGFELEPVFQNLGVSLLRNVAKTTHDRAGDGSVMAVVIAQALIDECALLVQQGHSPVTLRNGLRDAAEKTAALLKKGAKPVTAKNQMEQLITTSTGGDRWPIEPIMNVQKKLGNEGVLIFGYTDGVENEVSFVKGFSFEESFLSPYFDIPDTDAAELEDPYVLIHIDKMHDMDHMLKLVEKLTEADRPLLIITEAMSEDVLSLLIINRNNRVLNAVAVKAPEFGDRRTDVLQDIAAYTGTTVYGDMLGKTLEDVQLADLGRAGKVRIERGRTVIMDGKGRRRINGRLKELRERQKAEKKSFERQNLETRIAKMTSGIGHIRIGGYTEQDKILRRMQIASAYRALQNGMNKGFVPGGGLGIMKAVHALQNRSVPKTYRFAYNAFERAVNAPAALLAEGAGKNGDYVREKIVESRFKKGFNALSCSFQNTSSYTVIDPVETILAAIESAVSFAVNLLSTEIFIADEPYLLAEDEAPMLGVKGYRGMQGIAGMEHDHE